MKSGSSFILREGKWRRVHPVSILLYTKRFWFFLVIPTLRGLIFTFFSYPVYWAETMWIDVAVLGTILLYGCFCWAGTSYRVREGQLTVRKGLIFSREWRFPLGAFHGIFQVIPLVFQPFPLAFFELETLGGRQGPDVRLLLSRRRGMELLEAVGIKRPAYPAEYRPRPYHLALFALLCSNSFGGVVLLGILLSRTGSLIGRQLEQEFAGALVGIAQRLAVGIPLAAAAASLLLLAGWFFGFLRSLGRHYRLLVQGWDDRIQITSGLWSRRTYLLEKRRVCALRVWQPLLAFWLGRETLLLHAAGMEKKDRDWRAVLLACPKEETQRFLGVFFPEISLSASSLWLEKEKKEGDGGEGKENRFLRPGKKAIFRYTGFFFFLTFLPPLLGQIGERIFFPESGLLVFAGWMAALPSAGALICNMTGFFRTGITVLGNTMVLCSPSFFSFERILVPLRQIRGIRIRRSFWQRMGEECDLLVYFGQDRWERFHLKALPMKELWEMLKNAGWLDEFDKCGFFGYNN